MTTLFQIVEWLFQLMTVITVGTLYAVGSCVVALLSGAFLAPVGALRWWAGWSKARRPQGVHLPPPSIGASDEHQPAASQYVVYLSGIGNVAVGHTSDMERTYLQSLAARLPESVIIWDVFAFSVENIALADEQLLGRFWLWLHINRLNQRRISAFSELINLRNALQLLVSADKRYGPIYSYGTASTILQSLVRHGYPVGSGTPVTLIGYSGGGQISLGSATYLSPTLAAPVQLISLAGVMNDDPGIEAVERISHLYGARDGIVRIGDIIFPGRWETRRQSRWNRALRAGKIQRIALGPMTHNGPQGYFDASSALHTGQSYLDHTVDETCRLIADFSQARSAA